MSHQHQDCHRGRGARPRHCKDITKDIAKNIANEHVNDKTGNVKIVMEDEVANDKIVVEDEATNINLMIKIVMEDKQICLDIAKDIAKNITKEQVNNQAANVKIVEDKRLHLDIAKDINKNIAKEHINDKAETAAFQSYSHTEYCAPGAVVPVTLRATNKCMFLFYRLWGASWEEQPAGQE